MKRLSTQPHFRLPFCLRSACRANYPPALRTHALLPKIRSAFQAWTVPPRQARAPFHESFLVALGGVASAHPSGKHVPHSADKPK